MAAAAAPIDVIDEFQISTNRILNQLDPCKDLAEGPTNAGHNPTIIPLLEQLFVPGGAPWPWGEQGVGDTKTKILQGFHESYKSWITDKANSMQILRESHTSGHSQRPEGFYVSQDSGSPQVVKNPRMIVTPGNILDPAGKTKKGATFVVSMYSTLPFTNIQRLGLDTIINGPVSMVHTGTSPDVGTYTVSIPTTNLGTITGTFNAATFKAAEDSKYFQGNPVKNKYIKEFAEGGATAAGKTAEECKKYLLCKELGDTLQVEWLNTLFGTGDYKRENTVIITCDTVVFWRSIINGVGVIFTLSGKTKYYNSRQLNEAQKLLIEAAFIKSIREEVLKHNQSVLNVIQEVINEPRKADTNAWINGNSWNTTQHANCLAYLRKLHEHLINMNKDIALYFDVISNVEAAKLFAARSHFQNPFVWYPSGQFFKVNKKLTYLFGVSEAIRYSFSGAEFGPSYFNTNRVDQAGGVRTRGMTKAQKIENAKSIKADKTKATWDSVIELIIAERNLDKEGYQVSAFAIPNAKPPGIVGNIDRYDLIIWTSNIKNQTAAEFTANIYFAYLYIRDYHPEIFIYAQNLATAIGNRGITAFPEDFETLGLTYTINENDLFVIKPSDPRVIITADTLKPLVLQAIGLTMRFVDEFPALQTENLMDFLTLFRAAGHGSLSSALPDLRTAFSGASLSNELLAAANSLEQQGGSEIERSNPLFDAIDLYEIYYSYKIRAAYEDRDLTKEEQKQLEKVAAASSQKNKPMASFKKVAPQLNQNLPIPTVFGGKRFKKTKKRKMSRKKRQTRRSAKRISKK